MLLSIKASPSVKLRSVASGEFLPIGCDLHHHRNLFTVCVHGLLRSGSEADVRTTVSAYKVDTVIGHEMWRLLEGTFDKLLKGIRDCASIKLSDVQLLESGDILWDESRASAGSSFAPFELAASLLGAGSKLVRATLSGFDRHPAQLSEVVHITAFKVVKYEPSKSKKLLLGELVRRKRSSLAESLCRWLARACLMRQE